MKYIDLKKKLEIFEEIAEEKGYSIKELYDMDIIIRNCMFKPFECDLMINNIHQYPMVSIIISSKAEI